MHPYLKRRQMNPDEIEYPYPRGGDKDELKNVLRKTLGVPLFQEQAMRIAMTAAEFTSEEANGLRRAMATFRNVGTMPQFEERMVNRMIARGYDKQFSQSCFDQIKGFGSYGFPESHAASFAQLVYVSSWLKCFHPDAFACGLLNSQPMGFYAPAQIVGDARQNGVTVREIDVSFSHAQNTLEERDGKHHALRLGFRQIDGFKYAEPDEEKRKLKDGNGASEDWAEKIFKARERQPFSSLEDFARRTLMQKRALILLADADAFRSLGLDRREALWTVRRLPDDVPLPLFTSADAREQPDENARPLPEMPLSEHVVADYQTIRLSLKGHPMEFLRPMFEVEGAVRCEAIADANDRQIARCAGVVLVRQRPGSAKGVVFITLEDETGIANVVVWPKVMEKFRKEVMGARLLMVEGRIQSSPDKVVHLVAEKLFDRTPDLKRLSQGVVPRKSVLPPKTSAFEPLNEEHHSHAGPRMRHPRNVRILPRSRDFH